MAGALFGKEAFKNCIVTGIVLAEDGKKMSKKLKNYPDPSTVMEKYGADAMRFYMLSSPVVQADNLSFSESGVDEIVKKNLGRLYNVLAFYQLYKDETHANDNSKNILDVWMISKLNKLIENITAGYENYRVDLATRPLTDFIDELSVWYLRRSRDRFKEEGSDKADALATLRYILYSLSLLIAPVMPFFAEKIYQDTKPENAPESIHLCSWPSVSKKKINKELEEKMDEVRLVVNLALAERTSKAIKVKQPLASLKIKNIKSKIKNEENLLNLIKDEINVKEIIFDEKNGKDIELDLNITEELKEEGQVREIIRFAQEARKNAGLRPGDEILANFSGDEKSAFIIEKNKEFIAKEIRAKKIEVSMDVGKKDLSLNVSKI